MTILEKRIKFLRDRSDIKLPKIGRYSISMLVNDCVRDMYFQMRGKKKTDDKTYEIMDNGTIVHDVFEELFPNTQVKFVKEVERHGKKIEIVGKLDAVHKDRILEAKSCMRLPEKPKPAHVKQLRAYFWGMDMTEGYLIYFLNNAEHPLKYEQVFKVEPDQKTVDKLINKAWELHDYLTAEVEPPRCSSRYCSCAQWENGV